jgi:hypothetical protein
MNALDLLSSQQLDGGAAMPPIEPPVSNTELGKAVWKHCS